MWLGVLILVAVAIGLMCWLFRNVFIVEEGHAVVVSRLGRVHRVLHTGFHAIWPLVERPRLFQWSLPLARSLEDGETPRRLMPPEWRLCVTPCAYDVPPLSAESRDGITVTATLKAFYQITAPALAVTAYADLFAQMQSELEAQLRAVIAAHQSTELGAIAKQVSDRVISQGWEKRMGVRLDRVEVGVQLPESLQRVSLQRAESERRAVADIVVLEDERNREMSRLTQQRALREEACALQLLEQEHALKIRKREQEALRQDLEAFGASVGKSGLSASDALAFLALQRGTK